jgi:diguanylate cyclase (GGDEF)-like protein
MRENDLSVSKLKGGGRKESMSSDRRRQGTGRGAIFEVNNHLTKRTFLRDDQCDKPVAQPRVVESTMACHRKSQTHEFDCKILCAVSSRAKEDAMQGELLSMAFRDDLTGLYNRRGFLMLAEQQLKLARRNGHGAFLFFLDLDELKKINDTLGHQTGDFALVDAADLLRLTFRDSDVMARFGGDEFAVLVLEAGDRSKEIILRRLQENQHAKGGKHRGYRLSLSVGSARFDPLHPSSIGELMVRADEAMYEQKRNRGIFSYSMMGEKRA